MRFDANDRVASFSLSLATAKKLGVLPEDNEGLIDHLRAIRGVIVAVFFEELADGKVRVSMRSKNEKVERVRHLPKIWRRRTRSSRGSACPRLARGSRKEKFWRKFVMLSVAIPDGVLLVDKAEGMTSHDVVAPRSATARD